MRNIALVSAGDMRERITIQKRVVTIGPSGGENVSWQTRASCRAHIRQGDHRAAETLLQGAATVVAVMPTLVTICWRRGVSVTDRVLWGDKVLQVKAVRDPEDSRRRWLELTCVEVQP